jgi:hypothetical protein
MYLTTGFEPSLDIGGKQMHQTELGNVKVNLPDKGSNPDADIGCQQVYQSKLGNEKVNVTDQGSNPDVQ